MLSPLDLKSKFNSISKFIKSSFKFENKTKLKQFKNVNKKYLYYFEAWEPKLIALKIQLKIR
jgi:hypothetical protein